MAHFREMLDGYRKETLAPDTGHRKELFQKWEQQLKAAIAKLEALRPRRAFSMQGSVEPRYLEPTVLAPGLSVKERVKFFTVQIDNVNQTDRLANSIKKLRLWLFRQGATLGRDGTITDGMTNISVTWDRDLSEQNLTKLTIRGGLLYATAKVNDDGTSVEKPFDTTTLVTAAAGPGWAIYVLSAENNFHAMSHSVGHRHHSSLLAGNNVLCAGEMQVKAGKLQVLTNKSGHYKPTPVYMTQAIRALAAGGISEDTYIVEEVLYGDHLVKGVVKTGEYRVRHANAKIFMDLQRFPVWPAGDIDDSALALSMSMSGDDILVDNEEYADTYAGAAYGDQYDNASDDDEPEGYVDANLGGSMGSLTDSTGYPLAYPSALSGDVGAPAPYVSASGDLSGSLDACDAYPYATEGSTGRYFL